MRFLSFEVFFLLHLQQQCSPLLQTDFLLENDGSSEDSGPVSLSVYLERRQNLIKEEESHSLGGDLRFESSKEIQVNDILMKYKRQEYDEGLDATNGLHFAAAHHFFHVRNQIEASKVFRIIKQFPKGCALHAHDKTTGSVEWIVNNLTHWPNLYICIRPDADDQFVFKFADKRPEIMCNTNDSTGWTSVESFRRNASSSEYVNELFLKSMTMFTQTPESDYQTANEAWFQFNRKLAAVRGILEYSEAIKAYHYQTMQEFHDDNVQYIESRTSLDNIFNLNGTKLSPAQILESNEKVTNQFVRNNPDFWGAKFIMARPRTISISEMRKAVDIAIQMKNEFPKLFIGFDIVAHEDVGNPNFYYISELLRASNANLKFFFHAGETDWHSTKIDDDLLDAILLNATRIGHGNALNGRPHLVDLIKMRGIGLEVNPISNQVLKYVEDIRTHPAVPLLRKDFPVTISSDDAGMWGATGLSYDFYMAFMAMGGERADLRFLKRLAMNSIKYSGMEEEEKVVAGERWKKAYSNFLDKILINCGDQSC